MNLNNVKLDVNCVIKEIKIQDEKTKIRLMELGLIEGSFVKVYKKSVLKKTLLIIFNSTMFTLKENIAQDIVVKYA